MPRTFVPGSGLTSFKLYAEYFLTLVYGAAGWFFLRRGNRRPAGSDGWLAAAAWTLALAEFFFTRYADVTDLFNLCGHIYKALAHWMIYRALFVAGVQAPFRALLEQEERLEQLVERRTAEVQTTLAQYRTLVDMAPVAITLLDRDFNYLAASSRWIEEFGKGLARLVGLNHYALWPECPEHWRTAHRAALAGELVHNEADFFRGEDGVGRWLHWATYPWRNERGEIAGIILFAEDITAGKLDEQALRDQEERLRLALLAGKSGTFEWDAQSGLSRWSDELLELHGLEPGEYGGRYDEWLACVVPEDREAAGRAVTEALRTGGMDVDFRIRHRRSGEIRWLSSRAQVSFDADGKPLRMLGIDIDITDRKLAEERLQASETKFRQLSEALRLTSERFQTALKSAPVLVFNQDRELRYTWLYNPSLGDRPGEFVAGAQEILFERPEDAALVASINREVTAGGRGQRREAVMELGGRRRYFSLTVEPQYDGSGQIVGITCAAVDLSEQKTVELALARERELLSNIVDNIPVMLCQFDPEVRHVRLNRCAQAISGGDGEDAHGWLGSLFPDACTIEAVYAHLRESSGLWREFEMCSRDGERVPSDWAVIGISDGSRIAIGIDLRQRKAAEEKLARHAERQAILLEIASRMMQAGTTKASLARIIFERVSSHLQADVCINYRLPAERSGMELVVAFGVAPEVRASLARLEPGLAYCSRVAASGSVLVADRANIEQGEDAELARAAGLRAFVCHPLCGLDGAVIGTFALASRRRDSFTGEEVDFVQTIAYFLSLAWERRRAEQEIQRLNADLERRVERRTTELAHANEALLKSNLELQRFAYVAAHDLQTPLRSIAGFAQLLARQIEGRLDGRCEDYARLVVANTRRMQILIDDLLAYSRLDAQARPFEATDTGRLLDEVLASLASTLGESGAEVVRGVLPTVMADRTQLAQLLTNLIENGIKYNRSGAVRIEIFAERVDDAWRFAVRDNGIGIDPRYHGQIFEVFKRLHTQQEYPGSGVGLAICQRIVDRHGGRIWLESAEGQGSTFYFTLPDGHTMAPCAPA